MTDKFKTLEELLEGLERERNPSADKPDRKAAGEALKRAAEGLKQEQRIG